MSEVTLLKTWREELASLAEDTETGFAGDTIGISPPAFEVKTSEFVVNQSIDAESAEFESFKDQVKGFAKAWGEIIVEFSRGCKDVVQQSLLTEDSYVVQKMRGPCEKISTSLRLLNQYLPEDRDPVHVWPVIFFVLLLALAGIPGVRVPMLEEFGVRLVTYDLPGFGESDPHPNRNLNSSALDMLHLANAVAIDGKFWVLGYSSGAMHAWAALKYIPSQIAGAAMFAPMVNPYQSGMTKEEISRTWEKWTRRRRLMFYLARRFPKFLSYFYHRTFLSGKHDRIDKWLSLSLGKRDKFLVEEPRYEEFRHRDVEESIRQGSTKPFIEEAVLQVSNWGFSLPDLQVHKKCTGKGIFPWLKFLYNQAECELTGFVGPIHIWQGMDDVVVPPSMTDYVARVLPSAVVHKLPDEGHLSYLFFCEKCHRQIFSTLFGNSQGPLESKEQNPSSKGNQEEALVFPNSPVE
ncbi:hypothetical protein LguiB_035178 [Lonicera macranthoides]